MKPYKISHCNVFEDGTKDVVINIELNKEDKDKIYRYHLEMGFDDYDPDDVSMLVWIGINKEGEIIGYAWDEQSYYPAEQGETYYYNRYLPAELESECIGFVKENYFGNESKYDC